MSSIAHLVVLSFPPVRQNGLQGPRSVVVRLSVKTIIWSGQP